MSRSYKALFRVRDIASLASDYDLVAEINAKIQKKSFRDIRNAASSLTMELSKAEPDAIALLQETDTIQRAALCLARTPE